MLKLLGDVYAAVFARRVFRKLNTLLFYLGARGLGVLNFESRRRSGEAAFLERHMRGVADAVVLDVGANRGDYAAELRALARDARIYAFEPHPQTFTRLRERCDALGIEAVHAAAGSAAGRLQLYDYADGDGSSHASLYRDVITELHKGRPVAHEVDMITLDDFAADRGLGRIHLLKIDTEGHELEVLKGFVRHIAAGQVAAIHFEFNEMNTASHVFFRDFRALLPQYRFYRMLPGGLLPLPDYNPLMCEIFAYQNIVALLDEEGARG